MRPKVTGDSEYYYGEQQSALGQEESSATVAAGGQGGYGVMVGGGGVGYASPGDWTKYFDTEYGVDYYHNARRG